MNLVKTGIWLALALVVAGCSTSLTANDNRLGPGSGEPTSEAVDLPDLGPAPELHNEVWLNTPKPLRLVDLRGKVVLLEFWTFG